MAEILSEAPPAPASYRRRLLVLVVPLVLLIVLRTGVGVVLMPVLVSRAPLLLVAISPLPRHLVLVSGAIDPVWFFLFSPIAMAAPDVFGFLIGREYGEAAIRYMEARSGRAGRWLRWLERAFERAGPIVLLFATGPLTSMMAGAARMRWAVWFGIELVSRLVLLALVRAFGDRFAEWIEVSLRFIETNFVELTAGSAALVLISTLLRKRQLEAAKTAPRD